MSAAATVYVVDDDPDVRRALDASISTRGHHVERYESAESFLKSYEPGSQGCLVLDLRMQGMSGLELQQLLAAEGMSLPIIFISGRASVTESVHAMKAGAVDFLEKPYRTEELLNRIDNALAQSARLQREAETIKQTRACYERLSPREREVLALLVDSTGSLSSKQLAQRMGISPRTVEHYRANLMSKMQVESLADLVVQVRLASIRERPAP